MANEPGNAQIKLDEWKLEEAAAEQDKKRADEATSSTMEEAFVEPKKTEKIAKDFAATEEIVVTGEYTAKLGDRMAGEPGNAEIKGVEDTRKPEEAVGDKPETMLGVTENLIVEITGVQQSYIDNLESRLANLKKSPVDGAGDSGFYEVPEDMRKLDGSLYKHAHVKFSEIMVDKNDPDVVHYYDHLRSVLLEENGKKEDFDKILKELLQTNEELRENVKNTHLKQLIFKNNDVINPPDFHQFFGLLLSGGFILDVFHKWHTLELSPGKDPKLGDKWASELWADLLLVENQIPFFILRDITKKSKEHKKKLPELEELIFNYFRDFVPMNKPERAEKKKPDQTDQKNPEFHHLLDFVYQHLLPRGEKKNQATSTFLILVFTMISMVSTVPILAWIIIPLSCIFVPLLCVYYLLKCLFIFPWKLVKYIFTKWNQWNCGRMTQTQKSVLLRTVPTATRLREAGIRFKPIEERGFVVEFENGELRLPRLHVRNSTKKLLMNLIVWEQCHKKAVKYFINYAIFMDYLVNTSKDVEILIQSRVIEHSLGKEDDVVSVFNGLGEGLVYRKTDEEKYDFLPKLSEELNEYCENKFNNWRANLMSEYFKSPWAVISLLAGVFLILLTVAQTFFSAYSYFRPPN